MPLSVIHPTEGILLMPSEAAVRILAALYANAPAEPVSLEVERQSWEDSARQTPLPPDTIIESLTLNGVPCEKVSFRVTTTDRLVIFLHGGGFNAGSCITHRDMAARLSLAAGMPVLLVDYRLAPEHPYPAAVEDVISVYTALLSQGYTPDRLAMGGDSAGGGLVFQSLLRLRDSGIPIPAALVTYSAWIDLSLSGETMQTRADVDPMVNRADLEKAIGYYIGSADPTDPHISVNYDDLHGFPPMLLHAGEYEIIADDSRRIAEKARAANVEAKVVVWPQLWHVFPAWPADLPEGQQAIDQTAAFLREKLHAK
jgi:epsilon-lactone hydrolase